MAIDFRKYILITSGVGAGTAVRKRELIGRLFTTNNLVPTGAIMEFPLPEGLADIGNLFGTSSEEYLRAQYYNNFISKSINRSRNISFARWVNADTEPMIFGGKTVKAIGSFTPVSDGTFDLTIGGIMHTITCDFTSASTLADVAATMQTQIRLETEAQFTTATVEYNAQANQFNFVGGTAEAATITITSSGTGTDIINLIEWNSLAIFSNGALTQTLTEVLDDNYNKSTNFGSYLFIPTLTLAEHEEIGRWNTSVNVFFQYYLTVNAPDAQSYFDGLLPYWGVGVTLASDQTGEFHEMIPMVVLASTDYSKVNSTKNYMYQITNLTPTVTETAESNRLDPFRINYYGRTQTAGQNLDFFQRGILMGQGNAPVDMNVYANEQWFKDTLAAEFMSLQLNLEKISANIQGEAQLKTTIQTVIDLGLFNGTISVGKELDNTEKLFIAQITDDELAWIQVQNVGYWFDVSFRRDTTQDGRVERTAVYTVIYSKDDVVRQIEGSHILI